MALEKQTVELIAIKREIEQIIGAPILSIEFLSDGDTVKVLLRHASSSDVAGPLHVRGHPIEYIVH